MIFSKEWLKKKYADAEAIPFLFFWGHQPARDGSITRSCFSQWWESPFEVDGVVYRTAEHWMPLMWKGENLLGFALMEVREKLSR